MDKIKKAIKKIKSGDEEGFEYIYNEYKNLIFAIVSSYLKNNDDSDDCMQEIFFKIYSTIDQFDGDISSFKTWIYAITKNCIIDIQRKKNEYEDQIQSYASEDLPSTTSTIDYTFNSNLEELIGSRNYLLLLLRYGLNYSYEDMANEFNVSVHQMRYEVKEAENLVKDLKDDKKI